MYPQLQHCEHIPYQSCSVILEQDSLEYITYQGDRLDRFIAEYGPKAFYGGYEPKIILAS
jgi:hypothetical protein